MADMGFPFGAANPTHSPAARLSQRGRQRQMARLECASRERAMGLESGQSIRLAVRDGHVFPKG
jgi:hypothetical protein